MALSALATAASCVAPQPGALDDQGGPRAPAQEAALALPQGYTPGSVFSVVSEPTILRKLERDAGLSFAEQLGASRSGGEVSTQELLKASPRYRSLVEDIEGDLEKTLFRERSFRNDIGVGMNNDRRLFNSGWLRSKLSHYELVGVVNRLDRVAFSRSKGDNESGSELVPDADSTCGELRFIYRLAYRLPPYMGIVRKEPRNPDSKASGSGMVTVNSRLPMTVNVVYWVRNKTGNWSSCKRFATAWTYPSTKLSPADFSSWLTSAQGPIGSDVFDRDLLKSVEINLQATRAPSSVRPDMGGQAEYFLRAYKAHGDRLEPGPLENMPDVEKFRANPELKKELVEFLRDPKNLGRLDAGILLLPEKFLATKTSSFSPYASARLVNRPFDRILSPKDFEGAKARTAYYMRTPRMALKRLNDMSCVGCHQGSATAGFHFLGVDYPETHLMNSLVFEGSGHFALELLRRKSYLERVNRGLIPYPHRPFSVAPPETNPGHYRSAMIGQSCGLKGGDFEDWKCTDDARCLALDGSEGERDWGRCVPKVTRAGDPCLVGAVSQDADPNRDKIGDPQTMACNEGSSKFHCQTYKGGFPGGMCSGDRSGKTDSKREILGHFAGAGFNTCLAMDNRSFEDCINLAGDYDIRGKCNATQPCRPDYVCARTPMAKAGEGACTPSYFLFQLRLDGHPTPAGTRLKDVDGKESS